MTARALVLGGGGIFGIAWELGLLAGLADSGLDLVGDADVIVGTSAGSTVAALVTSGVSLPELYERQLAPADGELTAPFDSEKMQGVFIDAIRSGSTGQERRAQLGKLALSTDTVPEAARIEVIRQRLPRHSWPEQDVRVVAVDAETGEPAVFDRSSGVGSWTPWRQVARCRASGRRCRSTAGASSMAGSGPPPTLIWLPMPTSC
jgi:NTE family protein